ncbi:MAG: EAL domain-containing protein [Lachnospiraceae bacterium]|nr:EAL domain-containing protein [Lachnospiraceae bacterium]
MAYNIQFQVAALVLVIITAVLLLEKRAIRLYLQQEYLFLFVASLFSIIFDISSVVAIMNEELIGQTFTHVICKIYLFTIALVACALSQYTYKGNKNGKQIVFWTKMARALPLLIQVAVLIIFPVSVYREDNLVYTYGICVITTYVVCFTYMVSSLFFSLRYFKNMNRHSCYAIWFLVAAVLLAALIQMMNNEILLVSLAMGVGMVYMYIKLENPETYIDNETHIFNNYACTEYAERMLRDGKTFYVAYIKVEGIHYIKEDFGGYQEKELLWQLASFLRGAGGGKTPVFRNGFFSFSMFCSNEEKLKEIVEQIKKRFSTNWKVGKMQFKLKYRIAYLTEYKPIGSAKELIETMQYFVEYNETDKAVVEVDEEGIARKNKLMETERVLQWAVDNDAVQMYYQPIFSIQEQRITALEALVRIVDEKGQIFMPGDFIPLAEKNGMILPLGNSILKKVCEYWKTGEPQKLGVEYIEVNLSVVQCMQDTLAHGFLQIMKDMEVPPEKINLEITETAAIHSEYTLLQNMRTLLRAGSSFALDDYGSGYSGLSNLLKLPLKHIKLDRELVWAYFANEKSAVALRHEIAMLHELGFSIIAEGVEDKHQYQTMKELGIEFIQGYYFSKPLPVKALAEFLENFSYEN